MIEPPTAEQGRMATHEDRVQWRKWGPYVSDRQWGTVREDYSATGEAWDYFPFDIAHQRVYRWGEDGIFGISDVNQHLCFALAMWNENDDRLKERLFGLSGTQGNHGEDVKEYYFYLDNLPSHAYMRALYKYPHAAFPYQDLIETNRRRSRQESEYELIDTGIFDRNAYFDVEVEYAKGGADDMLIRVHATNRGDQSHVLHLLPTLWFRNEWSWRSGIERSSIELRHHVRGIHACVAHQGNLGDYWFYAKDADALLFTENETNFEALYGVANRTTRVKDGVERYRSTARAPRSTRYGGHKVQRTLQPGRSSPVRQGLSSYASPIRPKTRHSAIHSTRRLQSVSRRRTHFMKISIRFIPTSRRVASNGKRSRVCSGPSSSIITIFHAGCMAIHCNRHRRPNAYMDAITSGSTSIRPRSCRCRTSGSIRGSQHGISPSTRSPLR